MLLKRTNKWRYKFIYQKCYSQLSAFFRLAIKLLYPYMYIAYLKAVTYLII